MCRSHIRAPEAAGTADRTVAATGGPGVWDRSGLGRTLRAADRDRETVVALLGEHTAAGRLTLAEFEERVAEAAGARTLADLDRLVWDLPTVAPARPAIRPARGLRHERWRPWLHTAAICVAIWAVTSVVAGGALHFWPFWVIVPWGVVLLAGGWSAPRHHRVARAGHADASDASRRSG